MNADPKNWRRVAILTYSREMLPSILGLPDRAIITGVREVFGTGDVEVAFEHPDCSVAAPGCPCARTALPIVGTRGRYTDWYTAEDVAEELATRKPKP